MVRTLYDRGYRIAMVADGLAQSFKNMMTQHGLYDCFEVMIYSECIKSPKPHPRMFKAAAAMMLDAEDYDRIVMVGNNLKRDIRGANGVGMISVYMSWSQSLKYAKEPTDELEIPRYTIREPLELVGLVERISSELRVEPE